MDLTLSLLAALASMFPQALSTDKEDYRPCFRGEIETQTYRVAPKCEFCSGLTLRGLNSLKGEENRPPLSSHF